MSQSESNQRLRAQILELAALICDHCAPDKLECCRGQIAIALCFGTRLNLPLPKWFTSDPELAKLFHKELRASRTRSGRQNISDAEFMRQIGISWRKARPVPEKGGSSEEKKMKKCPGQRTPAERDHSEGTEQC